MIHSESSATPLGANLRLAICVGWLALAVSTWRFGFVCDDAFISFRYADHLARGLGLTFNPGERPPVEGYSNLFWIVVLSPMAALSLDLSVAARVLGGLCSALTLASSLRFLSHQGVTSRVGLSLLGLVLGSAPPFAAWTSGGLETAAFALCVWLVFERLAWRPEPRVLQSCLAAAAATLLRVDGLVWVGLAVVGALALGRGSTAARSHGSWIKPLGLVLACALAAYLLQLVFRWSYHDDWLSNTARVKRPTSWSSLWRGTQYVGTLCAELPWLLAAPLLALALARSSPVARAGGLVFALGCFYAMLVGGDFMALGRFLMPALPFAVLALGGLWARPGRATRFPMALLSFALVCNVLCSMNRALVPDALRQALHFRGNDARAVSEVEFWRGMRARASEWAQVGRALALHVQPQESIVLANVGATAYYSGLAVHDVFGLVDRQAARDATVRPRASPGHDRAVSMEYFLPRRPTYLLAWIAPRDSPPQTGLAPGMMQSSLVRDYQLQQLPLPGSGGFAPNSELRTLRLRSALGAGPGS